MDELQLIKRELSNQKVTIQMQTERLKAISNRMTWLCENACIYSLQCKTESPICSQLDKQKKDNKLIKRDCQINYLVKISNND